MAYTGIKQVREINGQQFIDDFKRLRTCVACVQVTDYVFKIRRMFVWDLAKRKKVNYIKSKDVYANGREVMVII